MSHWLLQPLPVLWPYVLSAAAVGFWLALLRRQLAQKAQFVIVAFVSCAIASMAVEFCAAYLVPLDIAGTAPPDPRNAGLRFLITAAVQVPVALGLAYWIAARTRLDRWERP